MRRVCAINMRAADASGAVRGVVLWAEGSTPSSVTIQCRESRWHAWTCHVCERHRSAACVTWHCVHNMSDLACAEKGCKAVSRRGGLAGSLGRASSIMGVQCWGLPQAVILSRYSRQVVVAQLPAAAKSGPDGATRSLMACLNRADELFKSHHWSDDDGLRRRPASRKLSATRDVSIVDDTVVYPH